MKWRTNSLFTFALGAGLLWSVPVAAKTPKGGEDNRPWGKGLLVPSFGLGGSFSGGSGSLFAGALSFGGGASYFVANGVAVGASFNNDIRFFSKSARDDFLGIDDNVPTYSGRLTPQVTFVPFRSRGFSPYIRGGVGPVFLNNGGGVLGEWSVSVGGWIGIGKRAALDIGLGASQSFPNSKCADAWSFDTTDSDGNPTAIDGTANCGIFFYPRVGLVFGIQASPKRSRKSKRSSEPAPVSSPTTTETPASPDPEIPPAQTETFAPPAPMEPASAPSEPAPSEPSPSEQAPSAPSPSEPAPASSEPAPSEPSPSEQAPGVPDGAV